MKKADAILCGDIHLRETVPICRTDDFFSAQWRKLEFIANLQVEHDCPVLCSGDLFDHWKPSPWLLSKAIEHLPKKFYTVYGQHDLPNHSLKLKNKSGIYTLEKAKKVNRYVDELKEMFPFTITFGNWGNSPDIKNASGMTNILIWHKYTYKGRPPFPGITSPKAIHLLNKYPQFDLIVTGDNHIPFTQKYDGRLLVNVGSMMRQDADQIDYRPAVWLYYADTNEVEKVYLPIEKDVISREHIEEEKERDNRISAFVDSLHKKNGKKVFRNFEQNMKRFLRKNEVDDDVVELIHKAIDND